MKASLPLLVLFATASLVHAVVVYDEGASGDLSSDNLSPTPIVLLPGSNDILGTTTSSPLDRDFFTVTVPTGFELTQVILETYQPTGGNLQSFFGLEIGNQITSVVDSSTLLGWLLVGFQPGIQEGDDVLDDLAAGAFFTTPFSIPLGPGDYTFWYQETNGPTAYGFDLDVQPIPEPSVAGLFALAGFAALRRRRVVS
ncbi:MAG: PEP-CTERM sorting domain-containing protein [Verrucomicrobiota bacterium]